MKLKYRDNNFIKDKIRQQLQILRDKGILDFVARGVYRKSKHMKYINDKEIDVLNSITNGNSKIRVKGIFKKGEYWIAFDNSSDNCFVEEFKQKKMAIAWVANCFEVSLDRNIKIFKLFANLFYINNKRLLKTSNRTE